MAFKKQLKKSEKKIGEINITIDVPTTGRDSPWLGPIDPMKRLLSGWFTVYCPPDPSISIYHSPRHGQRCVSMQLQFIPT